MYSLRRLASANLYSITHINNCRLAKNFSSTHKFQTEACKTTVPTKKQGIPWISAWKLTRHPSGPFSSKTYFSVLLKNLMLFILLFKYFFQLEGLLICFTFWSQNLKRFSKYDSASKPVEEAKSNDIDILSSLFWIFAKSVEIL